MTTMNLLEKLADLEHDRWSRWQNYVHSKCTAIDDGRGNISLVIPAEFVKHWERQLRTKFGNLSETEKESDRKEARHTLQTIANYLDAMSS